MIDNANELADLEANYQHLRCCSNFHLLLTTRITQFEQAAQYRIKGLPENESLELFRKYYPKHHSEEDELFHQIRAAVDGNTLVLELLAKNLRQFNGIRPNYTLGTLVAEPRDRGLLHLSHSKSVCTDYQSRDGQMRYERPEDIIAAMYDLSELYPADTALLSVFAALPPESIPFGIGLLQYCKSIICVLNRSSRDLRTPPECHHIVQNHAPEAVLTKSGIFSCHQYCVPP